MIWYRLIQYLYRYYCVLYSTGECTLCTLSSAACTVRAEGSYHNKVFTMILYLPPIPHLAVTGGHWSCVNSNIIDIDISMLSLCSMHRFIQWIYWIYVSIASQWEENRQVKMWAVISKDQHWIIYIIQRPNDIRRWTCFENITIRVSMQASTCDRVTVWHATAIGSK